MELKFRPGNKTVMLQAAGPGRAILSINAQIVNPDSEGVEFYFKKHDSKLIVQKHLMPEDPDDIELKFTLEADVVNKLIESRGEPFYVNFAGNDEDLRLPVTGRLAMGQELTESVQPKDEIKQNEVKPEPPLVEPTPSPKEEVSHKKVPYALIATVAGGVVLLALLAIAIWYFILKGDDNVKNIPADTQDQENSTPVTSPVTPDNTAVTVAQAQVKEQSYGSCDLNSSSDDLALISKCMASKPDNASLLKLGNDALKSERCEIASRVFSSLGRSGAEGVALTYARYFDPSSDLTSSCVKKDAAQAKYWYEKAKDSGNENDVKAATDALEHMK